VDTVSAESCPRQPVAAYCVHASVPVLVPAVPQPVVTGRDEPHSCGCDTGNLPPGRCGAGDIHGNPHMGTRPAVASAHSPVNNSRRSDVRPHLENLHFYARKVMSMWRYRITRLLSRKYPDLVIPDKLAAEGNSRRDWNRFLDIHYRRGWNVNVSRVMDNATHVAVYLALT